METFNNSYLEFTTINILILTFRAVLSSKALLTLTRVWTYTRAVPTRVRTDGDARGPIRSPLISITALKHHALLVLKLKGKK